MIFGNWLNISICRRQMKFSLQSSGAVRQQCLLIHCIKSIRLAVKQGFGFERHTVD